MIEQIVSGNVKAAYDECYQEHNQGWRIIGAKYKSKRIIDICKGRQFKKVLEVGAGDGSIIKLLSDQDFAPEYHAVEISISGVDYIRSKKIKDLKSVLIFDGYHLPFEDNSFDLVILSHVLEHVEHERLLLREIKRVAHFFVIEVPRDYKTDVDRSIKELLAYGHINVYTPTLLRYLLNTEGFEIEKDLTSVIVPEVIQYNYYINQKKSKNFITDLKIISKFIVRKSLGKVFGRRLSELLANSYTVLCKKSDQQIKIF